MQIPADRLSPDVLTKIIEEFVLRESTDYGDVEYSLEEKVATVRKQLTLGKVIVLFDWETENVSLETA